jgi:molybdenum cofactor cytidylyltransferase
MTAVILSAGLSRRMGRFKPLLPLGTRRTIERVVDLFRAGGIEEILVVAGHRASEVRRAIETLDVRLVTNPDYQQGMFTSVLAGVRALPDRCRAFFVHPVDIPLVRPRTVQRLTAAIQDHPADLLYPTFDGRRGHPTLIRTRLVPSILRWTGDGGLKACLRHHEADSFELPVVDEAILIDLDTPGDYDRMQARLINEGLPSDAECRVLMEQIQRLPAPIVGHCRAVSEVARRLARALAAAGTEIDIERVRTAAMLHDIARTGKNHAQAGACLLLEHGFDRLAPIVGAHMDLDVRPDQPIDAAQVVFLADKVVEGERYADLDHRFNRKLEKFARDRNAAQAVERRWENARLIRDKVEKMTGRSIEAIVAERNPEG